MTQEITPDERTLNVIRNLDDMLCDFFEEQTYRRGIADINKLSEKISYSLKWITSNLNIDVVNELMEKDGEIENKLVIQDLFKSPYFNVNLMQ